VREREKEECREKKLHQFKWGLKVCNRGLPIGFWGGRKNRGKKETTDFAIPLRRTVTREKTPG